MLAALASALLAGCVSNTPRDGSPTTESVSPSGTPTRTPTATPVGPGETKLGLGEFYSKGAFEFTVSKLTLTTTFRTDESDGTYELQDDQLAIATIPIRNKSDVERGWIGYRFGFVVDQERIYGPLRKFQHPDLGEVYVSQLRRVDHADQYTASGYQLDPGEQGTIWIVGRLPGDVSRDRVEVGYAPDGLDESIPVRWDPSG